MIDGPKTLADMLVRHEELYRANRDIECLSKAERLGVFSLEVIHELLFEERQEVYSAASRKVATTPEELAAQFDIFFSEVDGDGVATNDDYHGQMMRSIRAGISGLSEPKGVNMEQFWTDYASLDDDGKKLVRDTAKAVLNQTPALKAAG